MMFGKRLDRARDWERERVASRGDQTRDWEEKELPLEKGDLFAMVVSSFFTLFLPAVLALLAVAGIPLLLLYLL